MSDFKYGISPKENPKEYRRLQSQSHRREKPLRHMLTKIKSRAKSQGVDCDLTEEDFLPLPEVCPILLIPLHWAQGGRSDNSYSMDRIDNSKGYVRGNCRLISFAANMRKGDLSIEQVERLLAYMQNKI